MAKVKVDFSDAKSRLRIFAESGSKIAAEEFKKQIVKEISEGRSPVKGVGSRLKGYSDSYKKAIDKGRYTQFNKRKRPVNLILTGKLLASIFTRVRGNKITIGFNNRLADIHNRLGAGKSKEVRRMLPTKEGEKFTDTILFSVGSRLKEVANRVFR